MTKNKQTQTEINCVVTSLQELLATAHKEREETGSISRRTLEAIEVLAVTLLMSDKNLEFILNAIKESA